MTAIAAGGQHSLAKASDGTVWTWGSEYAPDGRAGPAAPSRVSALSEVVAIAAGGTHSLAVKDDGTVWAWGNNQFGQLGLEATGSRTTPVQVLPLGLPDLAIAISHDGDFTAGSQGIYTLTITNIGAATANTITVTDTLPPGLAYISAIGDGWICSAANESVTCSNPDSLDLGASSTIVLVVEVGASAWPGVTNLATVSNKDDRNISNNIIGDPTVVSPGR